MASGSMELGPDDSIDLISITTGTQHGCLTAISVRTLAGNAYTLGKVSVGPNNKGVVIETPTDAVLGGFAATEAKGYCWGTAGARGACSAGCLQLLPGGGWGLSVARARGITKATAGLLHVRSGTTQ